MTFEIEGERYQVEFRHFNKAARADRAKLHYVEGINALTTCVVIVGGGKVVSIYTVFCSASDQFSRENGRVKALTGALERLGRDQRQYIPRVLEAYHRRNEPPAEARLFAHGANTAQVGVGEPSSGIPGDKIAGVRDY